MLRPRLKNLEDDETDTNQDSLLTVLNTVRYSYKLLDIVSLLARKSLPFAP